MVEKISPKQSYEVVLATPPPISHRTAEENLGLGYLASVLREEGKEVRIIDGWLQGLNTHQLAEEILSSPPEVLLGFSCYRSNMERTMEVASLLKESGLNVPLIVGGFGPTFHADEFLNAGFDVVVRGEAEETIRELYNHYTLGEMGLEDIGGISYIRDNRSHHNLIRPLNVDLDTLPFPSRDTLQYSVDRKSAAHILSARGCQAHCVFCSIVAFQKQAEGPQWRQRSITNFVDELEDVANKGVEHFKVIDDSLIESPRGEEWAEQLANEIERRNLVLTLRGSIRADRVTDKLMGNLRRAGFIAFSCGIENGSDSALKRMGKSANVKKNREALDVFKRHGIFVQAGHILFDHGTTMEELEENYEFMSDYIWTISKGVFTEMYAANGTPFTKRLQNLGIIQLDSKGLGNNVYPVLDPHTRIAYNAMKLWHKSHSPIYDKTIDPISAPKALNYYELLKFHPFCISLREIDLNVMKNILDRIIQGKSEETVVEYVKSEIQETERWYKDFELQVDELYDQTGLIYDADVNPFLD